MSDLWFTASEDTERDNADRLLTAARTRAVEYWPFVASAANVYDFNNRMALVADRFDEIVASVTEDPGAFIQTRAALEHAFTQDFAILDQRRAGQVEVAKPGHWTEDGEYVNEPGGQMVDEDEYRKKHNLPKDAADDKKRDRSGDMEERYPEDAPHDQMDDPWNQGVESSRKTADADFNWGKAAQEILDQLVERGVSKEWLWEDGSWDAPTFVTVHGPSIKDIDSGKASVVDGKIRYNFTSSKTAGFGDVPFHNQDGVWVPEGDPTYDDDGNVKQDLVTCGNCGRTWNDAVITGITPAPGAMCPFCNATAVEASRKTAGDWETGADNWETNEVCLVTQNDEPLYHATNQASSAAEIESIVRGSDEFRRLEEPDFDYDAVDWQMVYDYIHSDDEYNPYQASKTASEDLTDDDLREMAAQGNELAAGMLRIREDRAHSRQQMDDLKSSKTADMQGIDSDEDGPANDADSVQNAASGTDDKSSDMREASFHSASYMKVRAALSPENQRLLDSLDPVRAYEIVARLEED